MIQDIAPHKFYNAYTNKLPSDDSFVLYFNGQSVLMAKVDSEIRFPKVSEWKDQNTVFTYLFSIDNTSYYLANTTSKISLTGYDMESTKIFRTALPKYTAFAGITAFQLNDWYKNHKFCGKCGGKMVQDTKERMLFCDNCHTVEYPKICPAVIVAISDGDNILLSKYANGPHKNYALIAGFTEIGETIEETAQREVMEEVGLHIKNIRYYKSQPWSFSGTLLFGFFADLDGDPTITLDKRELSEACWVPRHEIQVKPNNLSLTNEMILKFKNEK